ncbi:MAG: YbaB/EbfC family nucleoid-associated protein [Lachnospiraceae bacterium]|nr:YbaB/EbfC family nucleoid-associated protein [Lachnospiraceae bacterium]
MAKHGGYMGGMPGNMQNLMKQAQRMQRQMEESKKALDEKEFTAKSGGGAVEVVMMGDHALKSITISKEAVDPDDVEMLQDLIVAAVGEANRQISEAAEQAFGGMAGL